jgi:hypothetical protein
MMLTGVFIPARGRLLAYGNSSLTKKAKYDPKLVALASELAKHMKTESDISSLSQILTKLTVETAIG